MTGAILDAMARRAFEPVAGAVAEGRIPGAALGVISRDGARAVEWTGHATLMPAPEPLTRDTWFDIASLTKVLLTTPEVLRLVEHGDADLDDPLAKHLPDLAADQADAPVRSLTLRQCLTHQTFLPAVAPIWQWGEGPEGLKAMVLRHPWPEGPPVYSDINFILLGLVLERRHGRPLTDLTPSGLSTAPPPQSTAATEDCPWRRRLLRGEVHDETAFALGGVAGHAGLFGTVDAVLDQAAKVLDGSMLSPAAMAEMCRPHWEERALGWQIRHAAWTGGNLCSPGTLGHTGFPGVGLWTDRERGIAWTLLTNRVHPTRHKETGIMDLRRSVSNRLSALWRG